MCIHPYYMLEKSVLIIVPEGNKDRYFDRLKKGDKFNIDDALIYN